MEIKNPKKENIAFAVKFLISLVLAVTCLILTSCDIAKDAFKKKETNSGRNITEEIKFRKGDTVHFEIPNIRYKDTVIYTVSHQGTKLITYFDKNGNVSDVNCVSSEITEIKRQLSEYQNNKKEKEKHKTEEANLNWILYLVGGIVILGIVALLLLYNTINRNSKAVEVLLGKIT